MLRIIRLWNMRKIVLPLNQMPDGSCRTVKAQYQQTSLTNLIRSGGGYAATGVIEIVYETDTVDSDRQ